MNQVQETYALAKSAYDLVTEEIRRQLKPHEYLLETEKGIDEFVDIEMKVEADLEKDTLRSTLYTAENSMINWAIDKIKAGKISAAHLEDIDTVYRTAMTGPMIVNEIRRKLIDLSARLA